MAHLPQCLYIYHTEYIIPHMRLPPRPTADIGTATGSSPPDPYGYHPRRTCLGFNVHAKEGDKHGIEQVQSPEAPVGGECNDTNNCILSGKLKNDPLQRLRLLNGSLIEHRFEPNEAVIAVAWSSTADGKVYGKEVITRTHNSYGGIALNICPERQTAKVQLAMLISIGGTESGKGVSKSPFKEDKTTRQDTTHQKELPVIG